MSDTVAVPKSLIKGIIDHLEELASILETLEELLDEDGLKRVREGMSDYKEGRYRVVKSAEELRRELF
ncbi:MAG: hypothetical protein AYL29_005700 [Candidatus Bathyarchaeota archaeon B24]|nr:MAG: hypothetical protein AYL29_005700 [Candidatus Bathyarchaeota archaeon B24]RLI26234.1 MAG: hypothetical protein DRO57_01835 [Candidatus Bathyarchaeota archaeon]